MAACRYVAMVALVALFAVAAQCARDHPEDNKQQSVKTSASVTLPAGVTPADLVSKLTAFKGAANDLVGALPVNTGLLATVLNLVSGIVGQVLSLLSSVPGGLGSLASVESSTSLNALPLASASASTSASATVTLDLGAITGGLPGGLPLDTSGLDLGSLTSVGGLNGLVKSLTSKVPFVGNIGGGLPGVGGLGAVPLVGPLLGGLIAGLLGGGLPLLG